MSSSVSAGATQQETSLTTFRNSREHLLAGLALVDLRVRLAVARARAHGLNPDDEFRGLYISDEQVDALLAEGVGQSMWLPGTGRAGNGAGLAEDGPAMVAQARGRWEAQTEASRVAGTLMRLDRLAQAFDLTPLEVDALLLILAPEVDPRYERIYAYLQDDVTRKRPSVDLVLNLLTSSFDEKLSLRRILTDGGTLIRSQLVLRFADSNHREPTLLAQFLRPAGVVSGYLVGETRLDRQLDGAVQVDLDVSEAASPRLAPELAERLVAAAVDEPLFAFLGGYGVGCRAAARHVARALGRPLLVLNLPALKDSDLGVAGGVELVLRDGRILDAVLYLKGWDTVLEDGRPPAGLLSGLLAYPGVVIVKGEQAWQPPGRLGPGNQLRHRPVFAVRFDTPGFDDRLQVWQHYLGQTELDLTGVANNFRFSPGQIEDAIASARDLAHWEGQPLAEQHLFAASRAHSNQRLATLATKIKPRYGWRDIVLPADTFEQLREMVITVQQKHRVYGDWGFDRKLALGKGLHALFSGEPGTGKTMAAEIMAGELGLDLYKVDLSTLVSKYIGETEKNLDRIFSEAATSNAVLFFDEADAIFGKRSEVKDAHDRYANIEVSYLLQRMETYDGVVILATNLRANLDEAFTRRLHFAVDFPFPEPRDRERIWRVTFPPETPVGPDVDFKLLAGRFRIAGGNIRNIILAAAFLAAEHDSAVGMRQLLHATRREYQKMGRLIDETLFVWPEPPSNPG